MKSGISKLAAILFKFILFVGIRAQGVSYEVWLIDQSNSPGVPYGGRIYIWEGKDLEGEAASRAQPSDVIDLGDETAALCVGATGVNPVRPHMLFFSPSHSHAVLAFVVSGHVVIFDAASRTPVAAFRMSAGAGGARQAHAAIPSPDGSGVLVCNQNGKLLEWVHTNYEDGVFGHDPSKTIALASLQDPVLLPDNAPICAAIDSTGRHGFVTLRGGGLVIVDVTTNPMAIVALYDKTVFSPVGCGTQQIGNWMWVNAGGGLASKLDGFDVYRIPLASLAGAAPVPPLPNQIEWLFHDDSHDHDAHGIVPTKHGRYAWVLDRAANRAEVFESTTGRHVNTVPIGGDESDDPTPDLAAISPSGNRIFVTLRGPVPLSGDPHASTGSTPGLGIIQVTAGGRDGYLKDVVRISNIDSEGVERADTHGLGIRLKLTPLE